MVTFAFQPPIGSTRTPSDDAVGPALDPAATFDPTAALGLSPVDSAMPEPASLRVRMSLGYDGAAFKGWAIQPGLPTVQAALEEALAMIVRRPVRTVVAGRTDAGVHARRQVVHFDLTSGEWEALPRGREIEPGASLVRRVQGVLSRLGGTVVVHDAALAAPGFDARFSALWRRYSYRIADGPALWDPLERGTTLWHGSPLDLEVMNAEAASVLGLHNFLTFCKPREHATTIRTLEEFSFSRAADGVVVAHLRADAFCHNMVRTLIGAALMVGDGREPIGWMALRLAEQVRDSKTILADPRALVLEEVGYPGDEHLEMRAGQTRARRQGHGLHAR